MMRAIRHNHRNSIPASHCVLEVATVPIPVEGHPGTSRHKLLIGHAITWRYQADNVTRRDTLSFTNPAEFWAWLIDHLHPRVPLWLWAHSLPIKLGACHFWERLEEKTFRLFDSEPSSGRKKTATSQPRLWSGVCVTTDPPTIISVRHDKTSLLKMLDILNWFPCKLSDIAEECNLRWINPPGDEGSQTDWLAYVTNCAMIGTHAVGAIRSFVLDNDMGNMRSTVASQSMHLYRHRCITVPIVQTDELDLKKMERRAYVGAKHAVYFRGNVVRKEIYGMEAFIGCPHELPTIDKGPTYQLDMTACYPFCMYGRWYPTKYIRSLYEPTPKDLADYMAAYCACADVIIDSGDEAWPLKRGLETHWLRGRIETTLCGPELQRALKLGVVTKVLRAQLYGRGKPFDEFVRTTWVMRERYARDGKPLHAQLAKMTANSLHGKFSQKGATWDVVPGKFGPTPWGEFWHIDEETRRRVRCRSIGWNVQRWAGDDECADSFPLIAAYCTSYARDMMRQIRIWAGLRDTFYEDADMVIVSQHGYDSLCEFGMVHPHEMGKLKVVKVAEAATFWGFRDYQLDDEIVKGGIPRAAAVDPQGVWHHTNFLRADNVLMSCPHAGPVSIDIDVEPTHPAIRGVVLPDGWVEPLFGGR